VSVIMAPCNGNIPALSTGLFPLDRSGRAGYNLGMLKSIVGRIDKRLAATGLTARAASLQAGLGADAIRDMKRGLSGQKPTMSGVRFSTLQKLAPVLGTSAAWLQSGEGREDASHNIWEGINEIPIVSWVAAGEPQQALDHWGDWPTVTVADLPRGDWIALEVVGDSMDRCAPEGSRIIVNVRETEPVHRGLYVAAIGGQITFKRFLAGDTPMLAPYSTNPDHVQIPVTSRTRFIGRVRRTIKDW